MLIVLGIYRQKHRIRLAKDIVQLCRSLGFVAYYEKTYGHNVYIIKKKTEEPQTK